jgi:hypothetical protein
VFGLIGDDTPLDGDARRIDSAGGDDGGGEPDAAPGGAFCAAQSSMVQFCADFDGASFSPFTLFTDHGSVDLSDEQTKSGLSSMRARVDFSLVDADSDPTATGAHEILSTLADHPIPTVYAFEVYIPAAMAADIGICRIQIDQAIDMTIFASGTFGGQVFKDGSVSDFASPLSSAIQRDAWVHVETTFTFGMGGAVDVQIGSGPIQEQSISTGVPMPKGTLTLGLQQSAAPTQRDQQNVTAYYDNVLVR